MTVYNAAERQHVKAASKQAKIDASQRLEIIKGIMSLGPGRKWMHDILESCHIFASSFTTNALSTAFAEGERNIGLRLVSDIMQACPDQYVLMMREKNARDNADDNRRSEGSSADTFGDEREPGEPSEIRRDLN